MDDDERRRNAGNERRREDQDMARWRGGIDARMDAVERDVRMLVASAKSIDRTVTRVEGRMDTFQRELNESREEVRGAARRIDKGREDAVQKLEEKITAEATNASAWKLTKFQVFVGSIVAFLVPLVSTLATLALTGSFK